MVTTLGPPGEFQIPPPLAVPLPPGPGRRHSGGGPVSPSHPPRSPSRAKAPGPRKWGSPGKRLGSSALSLGGCCGRGSPRCFPLQQVPMLTPSLPRKARARPGGVSRDAAAFRPLHCRPRSPRSGTRGLRTSDPQWLGGAGTGLAATAAGRAKGGPGSLLLPPGGRGWRGDGGAVRPLASCGRAVTPASRDVGVKAPAYLWDKGCRPGRRDLLQSQRDPDRSPTPAGGRGWGDGRQRLGAPLGSAFLPQVSRAAVTY